MGEAEKHGPGGACSVAELLFGLHWAAGQRQSLGLRVFF